MARDQGGCLSSVGVVEQASDCREDDEDREIDTPTHSPLLAALSGEVDRNGKVRTDRIRGDLAIGKTRRDEERDRDHVIARLAAEDVIWRVPLQPQRLTSSMSAAGGRSHPRWRIRGCTIEAPAR